MFYSYSVVKFHRPGVKMTARQCPSPAGRRSVHPAASVLVRRRPAVRPSAGIHLPVPVPSPNRLPSALRQRPHKTESEN